MTRTKRSPSRTIVGIPPFTASDPRRRFKLPSPRHSWCCASAALLISLSAHATDVVSVPKTVHVSNDLPRGGSMKLFSSTMHLVRTLEIGGDEDESAPILAQVNDIAVDGRGRIYVAERAQDMVIVYDHRGLPDGHIGRRGEGPGEFFQPQALAFAASNELLVADQQSVSIFDSTRTFVSRFNHTLRDAPLHGVVAAANGDVYLTSFMMFGQEMIHRFSRDGIRLQSFCDSYARGSDEDFRAEQVFARGSIDLDRKGHVWYSQLNPYEIREFSPDGELLTVVTRHNEFMRRPEIMINGDEITISLPTGSYGFCVLSDGTIINSILLAVEQRDEGFPWSFLDVFAPDGKLKGSIAIEPPSLLLGRDAADQLYFLQYGQPVLIVRCELRQ